MCVPQVKDLTKFLDPSGLGVISFEDFHRGISAISNGGELSHWLHSAILRLIWNSGNVNVFDQSLWSAHGGH